MKEVPHYKAILQFNKSCGRKLKYAEIMVVFRIGMFHSWLNDPSTRHPPMLNVVSVSTHRQTVSDIPPSQHIAKEQAGQ